MKQHVELEVSNWLFFFSNLRSVHFPLLFYSLLGKVQRQSHLFFSTGTYRLTNERMKPAIPQKTCNRLKDDKALTTIEVDKTHCQEVKAKILSVILVRQIGHSEQASEQD